MQNIAKLFFSDRNTDENNLDDYIYNSWLESPILFLKLMFYMRDIKNGKGDKKVSFLMLLFLKNNCLKTYEKNIRKLAVEYGCINDLNIMAKYNISDESVEKNIEMNILANLMKSDDCSSLVYKWSPRECGSFKQQAKILANILFPNCKNNLERYRKEYLSNKIVSVENKMCKNDWNINYDDVPIIALKKYSSAFLRNDYDKFCDYFLNKRNNKNKSKNNIFEGMDNQEINILDILDKYDVEYDEEEINMKFNEQETIQSFFNVPNKSKIIKIRSNIDVDEWDII